jgi:uncharacterized RDD family membrane protein YckC
MKCPKCQYLSFGSGSRCRNCGYDFSLSEESPDIDLPIDAGNQPIGPLVDLPLSSPATQAADPIPLPRGRPPGDTPREVREDARHNGSRIPASSRTDLPLFTSDAPDDAPLVSAPAVPRPPLAVRRPAPTPPRPSERSPDPETDSIFEFAAPGARKPARDDRQPGADASPEDDADATAPALARILGGAIDVAIVGAIDAAVLYLTLRVTGLAFAEAAVLPKIPLAAFLILLNGGYLVLFTAAGGQTIGKMATGIRVVPQDGGGRAARVSFGAAVVRAAAYAASLLPAGLGFLPILFSQDGRTLHDRLSDTRVVKV